MTNDADARTINAEPWEPPRGMERRQCPVLPLLLRCPDRHRGRVSLSGLRRRGHQRSGRPRLRVVPRRHHAQSPTEARPSLDDRRRLGVRVARIVLRGVDEVREVPVDHPGLTQGCVGR